jgi:hypothetical protein
MDRYSVNLKIKSEAPIYKESSLFIFLGLYPYQYLLDDIR